MYNIIFPVFEKWTTPLNLFSFFNLKYFEYTFIQWKLYEVSRNEIYNTIGSASTNDLIFHFSQKSIPDGMAESDRATFHVDHIAANAQLFDERQNGDGERLIQFPSSHFLFCHTCVGQQLEKQ